MDPNATLYELLSSFHQAIFMEVYEREESLELLDALRNWIAKGGFPPTNVCKDGDRFEVSRQ